VTASLIEFACSVHVELHSCLISNKTTASKFCEIESMQPTILGLLWRNLSIQYFRFTLCRICTPASPTGLCLGSRFVGERDCKAKNLMVI
jgi:hypothetical protein